MAEWHRHVNDALPLGWLLSLARRIRRVAEDEGSSVEDVLLLVADVRGQIAGGSARRSHVGRTSGDTASSGSGPEKRERAVSIFEDPKMKQ